MTRILTEGFEMGDAENSVNKPGVTSDSRWKRTGTYACGSEYGSVTIIYALGGIDEVYFRFPLYMRRTYTDAEIAFTNVYNSTELVEIRVEGGQYPTIVVNGSTVKTSTNLFPQAASQYTVIEGYVKFDSSGEVILKVNGEVNTSYTGNTDPTSASVLNYIEFYVHEGFMDDLAINNTSGSEDNSWCLDGRVLALKPNDDGDNIDFTGSDGNSVDNYLLVDDIPDDGDTTFVSGSSIGDYDLYEFNACNLPTGQKIARVWVEARAKDPDTGDIEFIVKTNSVEYDDAADQTLTTSYDPVKSDVYTLNPNTSAEWTETQLDAIQAGIKIKS